MRAVGEAFLAPGAVVTGDVVLGPGANVWYQCVLRGDMARITLAEGVNVQDACVLHTDQDEPLTLGAGVVVGHGAILHCRAVGADSLIGIGARLLSRSAIGAGSIVAAGAVVAEGKEFPERSLLMGLPARVVREVTDEELERTRAIARKYRELARRYADGQVAFPFGPPGRTQSQ